MNPVSGAYDARSIATSAREPVSAPGQGGFAEMLDSQVRATSARDQKASASASSPTEGPVESPFGGLPMASKAPSWGHEPEDMSFEVRPKPRTSAEESMGAEEADRTTSQTTSVKEENTTESDTGNDSGADAGSDETQAEGNTAFAAVDTADTGSDEEDVATMLAKAKVSATETSDESKSAREALSDAEADNGDGGEAESADFELVEVDGEGPAIKTEPSQTGLEGVRTQPGGRHVSSPLTTEAAPGIRGSQWRTELVEQLQANQQMSQLKDGRIRLQLNEAGERMTVTLQEKNGVVSFSALTGSKAMAEAMTSRVTELREALADLGLALGDMDAQADDSASGDSSDEGLDEASITARDAAANETGRELPWLARSIVV